MTLRICFLVAGARRGPASGRARLPPPQALPRTRSLPRTDNAAASAGCCPRARGLRPRPRPRKRDGVVTQMNVCAVTGSASGIGAAIRRRLEAEGTRVIGVDIRDAEVLADLASHEGRARAVSESARALWWPPRPARRMRGHWCPQPAAVPRRSGELLWRRRSSRRSLSRPAARQPRLRQLRCARTPRRWPRSMSTPMSWRCSPTTRRRPRARLMPRTARSSRTWDRNMPSGARCGGGLPLGGERACGSTPSHRGLSALHSSRAISTDPVTGAAIRKLSVPLGRMGEPDEVAELAAFLLGPKASWIHGGVYYIDGGNDAEIRPDRF